MHLNYVEHFLISGSTNTRCVASPALGLKICVVTAGIKKYETIIKKKKKHDKIVLLSKAKLDSIKVLSSAVF